jgi:hypothetical protein
MLVEHVADKVGCEEIAKFVRGSRIKKPLNDVAMRVFVPSYLSDVGPLSKDIRLRVNEPFNLVKPLPRL